MPGSIDLSALAANLGNYYRESAQQIFSDMLLGFEDTLAKTGVTMLDGIKDEFALPNVMVDDILKPGGDPTNFAPGANKVKFSSRTLKVRPFKADLQIYPQVFEASWLTMIRKSKGTYTADNFPFYQFVMQKIVEKAKRELRFALWSATYNANGNSWRDIVDGYLAKITADVLAGNIIEVATGVVDQSNIIVAVEKTVQGLGDDYKDMPGRCIVSSTLFNWYITSTDAQGRFIGFNELSGGTNEPGQKKVFVRGTQIELVKEAALGTSQRIITTTDDNFMAGTDTLSDFNNIRAEAFERSIKIMIDGKIGADYCLANSVYKPISVNDQA